MSADRPDMTGRFFLNGFRPYLWIAAVITVLYAKSIWFDYTFLDDNVLILNRYAFLKDITNVWPAFLQKVFSNSYLPYYRPMLTLSFILDAQIAGISLPPYHAANIFFHITASCLVLLLLMRLGYDKVRSFIFGMIFAVHPVLSQGVAWIPGRNDTIMAAFILASFISFLGMVRTGKWPYYVLHLMFFLLAMFTKETALALIPVCLLYLHLVAKDRPLSRNDTVLAVGWAVSLLFWNSFRQMAVHGSMDINMVDAWAMLVMHLPAAVQFIGKMLFPFNLSVFPTIHDTVFLYGFAAIGCLSLAVLLTKNKRYGFILFGLGWMLLFLLPSLLRANYKISADFIEHRMYVPIIGFFIMALETDFLKKPKRRPLILAASVVIFIYAVITFNHIENFGGRTVFWENAVKTSPGSSFAHMAMGQAYFESGRLDNAEAEFRKCLSIDPLEPASIFGIGEIYMKKGMLREAEAEFKKTIAVCPFYDNAYLELGVAYYKQGKADLAELLWLKTVDINPVNIPAIKFLAIYYNERKDLNKARHYALRLRALGLEPPVDFMKSIGIE